MRRATALMIPVLSFVGAAGSAPAAPAAQIADAVVFTFLAGKSR